MMQLPDRNRLYLAGIHLLVALVYLELVVDGLQGWAWLVANLLLVLFIVLSHEPLLQVIAQATGRGSSRNELAYFSAFMELNQKLHNFLELDEVLALVDHTLKERIQIRRAIYLVASGIKPAQVDNVVHGDQALRLTGWPQSRRWHFHDAGFEADVEALARVATADEALPQLRAAFAETGTSLMLPLVQDGKLLGVMLLGRTDNDSPVTDFERQMYGFLANQLSIILDRIRVYACILHQTAMDHAEKMQVMQSLSANIAHEMRTPLSGIRASISGCEEPFEAMLRAYEQCSRRDPAAFPPMREDYLARLRATPKRVQLMIDQANNVIDMLLMNLRENALDRTLLHPIDARALVQQAVDRYPFKSGEREKLQLDLDRNFSFLGVESLCIYILFNLLKNAYYSIQSAQKGGILIRLQPSAEENLLIFRDTGTGIDAEILGRIFDGFFTTKNDGTGAGLAFCKRTIESFGGRIGCASRPGEYAEFTIALPVWPRVQGE